MKTLIEALIKEFGFDESDEYKSKKVFDKNSGYNISKDEEYYAHMLKTKWPDVQQSVTDDRFINPDTHRHFQMDFYIPSTNTIVQINKHWKHGRRPFNPTDPDCMSDVAWLKSQDGEFYDKVLHTWTELDPLKRRVAELNGFNYVEIFNMDEFNDWFLDPSLTYEEYKHPVKLQYDSDEYFRQKANDRDIYGVDSDPYAP